MRHRRQAAGHDGRPRDRRPHAPDRRTRWSGGSRWSRASTRAAATPSRSCWSRTATSRGRARRRASPRTSASPSAADVKAIVDKANADTAVLRNQVIGTQTIDILRDDPARLKESAMGNLVADAMRAKYPGVDAAITNSGGLRARPADRAADGRRAAGRDHVGRGVRRAAVRQPHGDRDADLRAARGGVRERLQAAVRRRRGRHRPHAAVLGPEGHVPLQRHRARWWTRSSDGASDDAARRRATRSGSSPTTSCSPVATATRRSRGGTNVLQPGDALLDVPIDYITANSPVAPVVDGRGSDP